MRSGRSPAIVGLTSPSAPSARFIEPEQTKPPGIASTSTPNDGDRRSSAGSAAGSTGRSLTTDVVALVLHAAGAHDDARLVERQVGRVEEEDLPDLGVERIDAEPLQRGALLVLGDRQLELDAVGVLGQREQLGRLFVRDQAVIVSVRLAAGDRLVQRRAQPLLFLGARARSG